MKHTLMCLGLFLAAGASCAAQSNAPSAPAAPAAPLPAVAPAPAQPAVAAAETVESDLTALFARIKEKLGKTEAAPTEALLAEELKELDALSLKHKDAAAEERAAIVTVKAMVFLQVLEDLDKGGALLRQVVAGFPQTETAKRCSEVLVKIAAMQEAQKTRAALAPGNVFPDFAAKAMDGSDLSLASRRGKVVLIDFWATWCGPCVAEMPNVIAAYEKFHAKGFEIIGISLDKDDARLKQFLAENKMTWPQVFDGKGWNSELAQKFGISSIPATFLLDAEGKIVAADLRGEALAGKLTELLERK